MLHRLLLITLVGLALSACENRKNEGRASSVTEEKTPTATATPTQEPTQEPTVAKPSPTPLAPVSTPSASALPEPAPEPVKDKPSTANSPAPNASQTTVPSPTANKPIASGATTTNATQPTNSGAPAAAPMKPAATNTQPAEDALTIADLASQKMLLKFKVLNADLLKSSVLSDETPDTYLIVTGGKVIDFKPDADRSALACEFDSFESTAGVEKALVNGAVWDVKEANLDTNTAFSTTSFTFLNMQIYMHCMKTDRSQITIGDLRKTFAGIMDVVVEK